METETWTRTEIDINIKTHIEIYKCLCNHVG